MNIDTLKKALEDLATVVPVAGELAAAPETALEYRGLMADVIEISDALLLAVHSASAAPAREAEKTIPAIAPVAERAPEGTPEAVAPAYPPTPHAPARRWTSGLF